MIEPEPLIAAAEYCLCQKELNLSLISILFGAHLADISVVGIPHSFLEYPSKNKFCKVGPTIAVTTSLKFLARIIFSGFFSLNSL